MMTKWCICDRSTIIAMVFAFLCVGYQSTYGQDYLVLYNEVVVDVANFPCLQTQAPSANWVTCSSGFLGQPISNCSGTALLSYDAVFISSAFAPMAADLLTEVISYVNSGGTVYWVNEINNGAHGNSTLAAEQLNEILSSIGASNITEFIFDADAYPNSSFTFNGCGTGGMPMATFFSGSYVAVSQLAGSNVNYYTFSGVPNVATHMFFCSPNGGVFGYATEFYTAGNIGSAIGCQPTMSAEIMNQLINPSNACAEEICGNGVDDDCDGLVDEEDCAASCLDGFIVIQDIVDPGCFDNILVDIKVSARGGEIPVGTPITFYDGNPVFGGATRLVTYTIPTAVADGTTERFDNVDIGVCELDNEENRVYAALNFDNTLSPIDLNTGPGNPFYDECAYQDNVASIRIKRGGTSCGRFSSVQQR